VQNDAQVLSGVCSEIRVMIAEIVTRTTYTYCLILWNKWVPQKNVAILCTQRTFL